MNEKLKKKLLRRLTILREQFEKMEKRHNGDGTPYYDVKHFNYYGGQAFGYKQGQIAMLETILDDFEVDF